MDAGEGAEEGSGAVGGPSGTEAIVRDFMASFIAAWPTGDASTLARFFSDDAEYHNGPRRPVKGRDVIVAEIGRMMRFGGEVGVDVRHVLADASVVMTERVDHVRSGEKTVSLRVAGVFEVHDGVITAWRDYFDSTELGSQLAGDG